MVLSQAQHLFLQTLIGNGGAGDGPRYDAADIQGLIKNGLVTVGPSEKLDFLRYQITAKGRAEFNESEGRGRHDDGA
jgi:hypothetical protein